MFVTRCCHASALLRALCVKSYVAARTTLLYRTDYLDIEDSTVSGVILKRPLSPALSLALRSRSPRARRRKREDRSLVVFNPVLPCLCVAPLSARAALNPASLLALRRGIEQDTGIGGIVLSAACI